MFCKFCGKELPTDALFCPNCGASLNAQSEPLKEQPPKEDYFQPDFGQPPCPPPFVPYKKKSNVLCIIGFVLSLVSLIISVYGTVAIAGLVLSIIGLVQTTKRNEGLKGLGIAGIAVSACSIVCTYSIFFIALLLNGMYY